MRKDLEQVEFDITMMSQGGHKIYKNNEIMFWFTVKSNNASSCINSLLANILLRLHHCSIIKVQNAKGYQWNTSEEVFPNLLQEVNRYTLKCERRAGEITQEWKHNCPKRLKT